MKTLGMEKLPSVSNFSLDFDSHLQNFLRKLFSPLTLCCHKDFVKSLKYFDKYYRTINITVIYVMYVIGVVVVMYLLFHKDFHENKSRLIKMSYWENKKPGPVFLKS